MIMSGALLTLPYPQINPQYYFLSIAEETDPLRESASHLSQSQGAVPIVLPVFVLPLCHSLLIVLYLFYTSSAVQVGHEKSEYFPSREELPGVKDCCESFFFSRQRKRTRGLQKGNKRQEPGVMALLGLERKLEAHWLSLTLSY